MAGQKENSVLAEVVEVLNENGCEGFAKALTLLLNTAMVVEREQFIGAKAYERTEERCAHSNGFKAKTVKSRVEHWRLPFRKFAREAFIPNHSTKECARSER